MGFSVHTHVENRTRIIQFRTPYFLERREVHAQLWVYGVTRGVRASLLTCAKE